MAATINLFINADELYKRFLWSDNGDAPRYVSIPKRCCGKGIYPSNTATDQNLGCPSVVQRTFEIKLNGFIFFVWNLMTLQWVIGIECQSRKYILKNEMWFMCWGYQNMYCGRLQCRLLVGCLRSEKKYIVFILK